MPHPGHSRRCSGLTHFRGHDLRHMAAGDMVVSGASLAAAGTLPVHREPRMTQRHAHLADDSLKGKVARMQVRIRPYARSGGQRDRTRGTSQNGSCHPAPFQ